MKKISLFLLAVLLTLGCTISPKVSVKDENEEAQLINQQKTISAPKKEVNQGCKINGYDCWAVVQKLGKTKEIRTENPDKDNIWASDIITYENKDLKALGVIVTNYTMFRDGGSTIYVLNDNISIHTNRSLGMKGTPNYGLTTIKFKDTGKQFIYNFMGEFIGNEPILKDF